MCLIVFAHDSDIEYPLVVAANRDEFHERPTAPSAFWPEHPDILAGRDLDQGGTWMGVTRGGRFAAVTNFRDPSRTEPAPRSRGELPLRFLQTDVSAQDFMAEVAGQADDYAGFNLLVGVPGDLWYLANHADAQPEALAPGIYGLSNARLDTPWPKVAVARERLEQQLAGGSLSHSRLAATVEDRQLASAEALRAASLHASMDRLLSAQFIVGDTYGTRATTTFWVERGGKAHWRELSYASGGTLAESAEFEFAVPKPRAKASRRG